MAIHLTVSHEQRLVIATASGEAQPEDMSNYLAEVEAMGAMPYRKIFDMRYASIDFGLAEIKAAGSKIRAYAQSSTIGPLAIVATSELAQEVAGTFAQYATAGRPFQIFLEVAEAKAWLDEVCPVVSS